MFRSRHWRTCFTWLAFAAILAAALVPSISRALASDRIGNIMMAEICAPSGRAYAGMYADMYADMGADMYGNMSRDMQQPGDNDSGHADDCAYCRLQADTPVLPGTVAILEPGAIAAPRPALFYQSPAPLFTWAAAKPRGPPLLA